MSARVGYLSINMTAAEGPKSGIGPVEASKYNNIAAALHIDIMRQTFLRGRRTERKDGAENREDEYILIVPERMLLSVSAGNGHLAPVRAMCIAYYSCVIRSGCEATYEYPYFNVNAVGLLLQKRGMKWLD